MTFFIILSISICPILSNPSLPRGLQYQHFCSDPPSRKQHRNPSGGKISVGPGNSPRSYLFSNPISCPWQFVQKKFLFPNPDVRFIECLIHFFYCIYHIFSKSKQRFLDTEISIKLSFLLYKCVHCSLIINFVFFDRGEWSP